MEKDQAIITACPKCKNTTFYIVLEQELRKDNYIQPIMLYRCSKCFYDLNEDGELINAKRAKL